MGDRLRKGIPSRYVTSQLSLASPGLVKSSTSFGWGKGGNVTSVGWQVTLCDPIWHVSSRSGEACCELLYSVYLTLPLPLLWLHALLHNVATTVYSRQCMHVIVNLCSQHDFCRAGLSENSDTCWLCCKSGSPVAKAPRDALWQLIYCQLMQDSY